MTADKYIPKRLRNVQTFLHKNIAHKISHRFLIIVKRRTITAEGYFVKHTEKPLFAVKPLPRCLTTASIRCYLISQFYIRVNKVRRVFLVMLVIPDQRYVPILQLILRCLSKPDVFENDCCTYVKMNCYCTLTYQNDFHEYYIKYI